MELRWLNRLCFFMSIACILGGVATSLTMIWSPQVSGTWWRFLASEGVVFTAALATLSVSSVAQRAPGLRREAAAEAPAR